MVCIYTKVHTSHKQKATSIKIRILEKLSNNVNPKEKKHLKTLLEFRIRQKFGSRRVGRGEEREVENLRELNDQDGGRTDMTARHDISLVREPLWT